MKLFKPKFWDKNNIIVFILWPLTLITRLIILIKNYKTSHKTNIKSICVGNIYLGGTGKTQLVIKLNEILKKKYKIFIIKKYYKNQIDEQKLLSKKANLILPKNRIFSLNKIIHDKKTLYKNTTMKVWTVIFDEGDSDTSILYLFRTQRIAQKWIMDEIQKYKDQMRKWEPYSEIKIEHTNNSWTIGTVPSHSYEVWDVTYTLKSMDLDFENDCIGQLVLN